MTIESYSLIYKAQTGPGIGFIQDERNREFIWLPKSQIEVDGVSCEEDFETLIIDERVDVYIPDWLAEKNDLL